MASAFAVLDFEEKLQLGDKTRFNGEKSFISPAAALTTMTVTPGLDGSALDVFAATAADRYLDWIFNSWTFDIVAGFNNKIDFDMSGDKVATLTGGTYTLATLLTEIAAALNAVAGISGTFTVTSEFDKITIVNDTASFELKPEDGDNREASILPHIGFKKNATDNSHTGTRVEYGHKKVSLIIGNGSVSNTLVKYVKLYSVLGDALFSSDQDLTTWEPDIMKWVPSGRSSFLNVHREAQEQVLYYLDKEGFVNAYNEKFTKWDIIDISEVNEWSCFKALEIIMWGISNKTDDVFLKKYFEYKKKSMEARERAVLRIDVDKDGVVNVGEQIGIREGRLFLR